MNGCTTCGGFGNRHDPIAHGTEIDWSNRECSRCGEDVWQAQISERGWCETCEVNIGPLHDRLAALAAEMEALGDRFLELNRGKSDYLYGRALSYGIAAQRIRMELNR